MLPELFEAFLTIIEDDHAVARVALRSPKEPRLMAAERAGQAIAPAKEVDGAGLTVVLRENATVFAICWRNAVPGYGSFGDDFLPSELIRIPLGQSSAGVAVFHHGQLKGKRFCVGEEGIGGKNRNDDRDKMGSACKQKNDDHGLEPSAVRSEIFGAGRLAAVDGGFDHDCPCSQQHRIHGRKVVVLSVKNKEYDEA